MQCNRRAPDILNTSTFQHFQAQSEVPFKYILPDLVLSTHGNLSCPPFTGLEISSEVMQSDQHWVCGRRQSQVLNFINVILKLLNYAAVWASQMPKPGVWNVPKSKTFWALTWCHKCKILHLISCGGLQLRWSMLEIMYKTTFRQCF